MPRCQIVRRRVAGRKRPSRGGFRASELDTVTRLAGIEGATFQAAKAGATVLAAIDIRTVDSAVRPGEQEATALVCTAFPAAGGVPCSHNDWLTRRGIDAWAWVTERCPEAVVSQAQVVEIMRAVARAHPLTARLFVE